MKMLTREDFSLDKNGHFASPATTYTVLDAGEGGIISLVLIANDEHGPSIDCGAGPHSTWDALLTELNSFIALDEAAAPKVTAVLYNPNGTSRAATPTEVASINIRTALHNGRLRIDNDAAAAILGREDADILQSGPTYAAYCLENDMYSDTDRNEQAEKALNKHSKYQWGEVEDGYMYGPVLIVTQE